MAPNARRHRVSVGSDRNQTRSAVGRNAASEAFFVATTERGLRYVLGKSRWKAQRNGDVSVLDLSRLIAKEKQKKYYQAPLIGCEKKVSSPEQRRTRPAQRRSTLSCLRIL